MEMLKRLHRTERVCWILIAVCIFFLFKFGIDLEYEGVCNVTTYVLHTITVVVFVATCLLQVSVVERTLKIESEVFNDGE